MPSSTEENRSTQQDSASWNFRNWGQRRNPNASRKKKQALYEGSRIRIFQKQQLENRSLWKNLPPNSEGKLFPT